jgi:deoxyribonuclease-1-like protein
MRVGCFNIQNISMKKIKKNTEILSQIATIISKYDIMFILELSDCSSDKDESYSPVLESIVGQLCSVKGSVKGMDYSYYANKKQGSTSNTAERVGVIYKNCSNIRLGDTNYSNNIQFNGFARNPFILPIQINTDNYIFIINHIAPSNVNVELELLNNVFNNLYKENNDKKFILMGDYNADGSFLNNTDEKNNPLFKNSNLLCLTNDETTNLSRTKCYDRVLCSANCIEKLNKVDEVDADNNKKNPYNPNNVYCDVDYLDYLELNIKEIKEISDHYPIFIDIKDI